MPKLERAGQGRVGVAGRIEGDGGWGEGRAGWESATFAA